MLLVVSLSHLLVAGHSRGSLKLFSVSCVRHGSCPSFSTTRPSRLSLYMTSLSRLPLHTPHSCRHHCDQSVSVPSCLLSGSAWLQTTLVFLVRAQTPIWAIPLVACEGGCSLRVGIYQMLLPLWETIINLGSAGNGSPPIAAHISSNTLSPLVDRSITFKQLKNSDIRRKSCFPTVLQSSLLFCIGWLNLSEYLPCLPSCKLVGISKVWSQ